MRYCTNCGSPIKDEDSFCDQCGTKVENVVYVPVQKPKGSARKWIISAVCVLIAACVGIVVFGRDRDVSSPDTHDESLDVSIKDEFVHLKNVEIGDTVLFGSYEQDNDDTNGKEDIEWIVLAKNDNKMLLLALYGLDAKAYNNNHTSITWETSTLRYWLNDAFYNAAFGAGEKGMICDTTVTADRNPSFSTYQGNDTVDKVFLLSASEADTYLSGRDIIICAPTKYALAQGGWRSPDNGNCWWWLRTQGNRTSRATDVYSVGTISLTGGDVEVPDACVRPAIWIDLDGGAE